MPTFLDLARKVASESGTVQRGRITSVNDQNDRVQKVVRWTADAYRQIQLAHATWRWMQDDFEGAVPSGQQRNSATTLGITRFGEWVCRQDADEDRFSIYVQGERGHEWPLVFQDWDSFYTTRLRGIVPEGPPRFFTISPRGEIVLYPKPAAPCVLRGPYRMAPQELVNDADVPEMPAAHHDLIVSAALVYLTTHDEAAATLQLYQLRQLRGFSKLEMDQLPVVSMGGTLA